MVEDPQNHTKCKTRWNCEETSPMAPIISTVYYWQHVVYRKYSFMKGGHYWVTVGEVVQCLGKGKTERSSPNIVEDIRIRISSYYNEYLPTNKSNVSV